MPQKNKQETFYAHGTWWAVSWPHKGRGATPRAAEVDLELKMLLLNIEKNSRMTKHINQVLCLQQSLAAGKY